MKNEMSKKDMKKVKCYVANPYGTKVVMIRDDKTYHRYYHALTREVSPVNTEHSDGVTHQLESDGDMLILIGWFRPWKVSTLAHECSHAAFRICGKHGVILKPDNNEAHAYLMGDMMDRFMESK